MAIKGNGLIILGIDQQREGGGLRTKGASSRINQQNRPDPPTTFGHIDGKATDPDRWQSRISRQFLDSFRWHIRRGNAR